MRSSRPAPVTFARWLLIFDIAPLVLLPVGLAMMFLGAGSLWMFAGSGLTASALSVFAIGRLYLRPLLASPYCVALVCDPVRPIGPAPVSR